MSSVVVRGLRLALGVLFVFGAAIVFAPAAQAQWTSNETCVYPTDIPELFYGSYVGENNCVGLCKQTGGFCRKFVKDGASCWQEGNKGIYSIYKKTECEGLEDPAERKACKEEADGWRSIVKDGVQLDRTDALGDCDAYQANCIEACSMPAF